MPPLNLPPILLLYSSRAFAVFERWRPFGARNIVCTFGLCGQHFECTGAENAAPKSAAYSSLWLYIILSNIDLSAYLRKWGIYQSDAPWCQLKPFRIILLVVVRAMLHFISCWNWYHPKSTSDARKSARWWQVRRSHSMLIIERQHRQIVFDSLRSTQPVNIAQKWSDVIVLPDGENHGTPCSSLPINSYCYCSVRNPGMGVIKTHQ